MSSRPRETNGGAAPKPKSSIRPAWDGNPPQAAAARERLLEAAARCIAREGLAATSVAAVAAEAGVSRQTVYRYFAGRGELAGKALRAAAEGMRTRIERGISGLEDPADMFVEAVVLGVSEFRSDPVLRAISDSSYTDAFFLARVTKRPGIEMARQIMAPAVQAAGWAEAEATPRLELVLRVFLSLIVSPSPERSPEELRAFLYRYLIPGLGLGATGEA